jgi:hypothetical protein
LGNAVTIDTLFFADAPSYVVLKYDEYYDAYLMGCVLHGVEMTTKIRFTLRGKQFEKEREDFVRAAKTIGPGRIQKYSTLVNGKRYPIRQLVASVTGLPAIAITSQDAYRILEKFGLTVDVEE